MQDTTLPRIFLIGFMGCGKSHWAKRLAPALGVPCIDLDEEIERVAGKSTNAIFAEDGEEHFRQLEREVMVRLTEAHPAFVMATGGGTPCFYNNIEYMNRMGRTLWINCSVSCLQSRLLKERDDRPLVRDLDEDSLRSYITRKIGDRRIYYQQASIVVEEDDLKLEQLLDKIRHT